MDSREATKRRDGTFTTLYPSMLQVLAGLSSGVAAAVLSVLVRYLGKPQYSPSVAVGTPFVGRAVSAPVSAIASELCITEVQVNNAVKRLKRYTVWFPDGANAPLLETMPGREGRRGSAAVYVIGARNEPGAVQTVTLNAKDGTPTPPDAATIARLAGAGVLPISQRKVVRTNELASTNGPVRWCGGTSLKDKEIKKKGAEGDRYAIDAELAAKLRGGRTVV